MPKLKKKHTRAPAVPYAKGFHLPTTKEQVKALGYGSSTIPVEFRNSKELFSFFEPLPQPQDENDWLAQYVESPQSYRFV